MSRLTDLRIQPQKLDKELVPWGDKETLRWTSEAVIYHRRKPEVAGNRKDYQGNGRSIAARPIPQYGRGLLPNPFQYRPTLATHAKRHEQDGPDVKDLYQDNRTRPVPGRQRPEKPHLR